MFKNIIECISFVAFFCSAVIQQSQASSQPLIQSLCETLLDIHGDKTYRSVLLPYPYYAPDIGDHKTFIHQGGYKVYNIDHDQHEVAVIGFLNPCIGIVVTDNIKVVAFHKDWSNSLDAMYQILSQELDFKHKDNLYARLFSNYDEDAWNKDFYELHRQKTHHEVINDVKDCLIKKVGIPDKNIPVFVLNLRVNNQQLFNTFNGRYDMAHSCVAIKIGKLFEQTADYKQIMFSSIDPFTEDIFRLTGKRLSTQEFLNTVFSLTKPLYRQLQSQIGKKILYDDIPKFMLDHFKISHGYVQQRVICAARMRFEEAIYYNRHYIENPTYRPAKDSRGELSFINIE